MMRLVKAGLMFGNLIEVRSPAMVARYNRALKHLIGKETKLTDFHIDISGYSPEIGDELGDDLYLNPNGVNRQFILLTTDQKSAPLLNVKFSTSRSILRQFIDRNEDQLFALTAREAVAGELDNSVFTLNHPRDLLTINEIEIKADTVQGHIDQSNRLLGMIDRFSNERDAWWDDVLIADMIETAKQTGDVTRNPIALGHKTYTQRNYYTAHFGGAYVFQDAKMPGIVAMNPDATLLGLKAKGIDAVVDGRDQNAVAVFLELNEFVEPIVHVKHMDVADVLAQKMDFIALDALAGKSKALEGATRQTIRKLVRDHTADMPPEFEGLMALYRWARTGAHWPRITSEHPVYFYTLRGADHADKDLVNMLLAELAPKDFRQLFICHKEAFYKSYAQFPAAKKDFVVRFLSEEYMMDKAGVRDELFGHEATMEEEPPVILDAEKEHRRRDDIVRRVGPWGAVK